VYALLDVKKDRTNYVVSLLRKSEGVILADTLGDRHPNVVLVLESIERTTLAEYTVKALNEVQLYIDAISLMPAHDNNWDEVKT
jgi:hypothetical protein